MISTINRLRRGAVVGLAVLAVGAGPAAVTAQAGSEPANQPQVAKVASVQAQVCLLYTSPSPRDPKTSRMPSSA